MVTIVTANVTTVTATNCALLLLILTRPNICKVVGCNSVGVVIQSGDTDTDSSAR